MHSSSVWVIKVLSYIIKWADPQEGLNHVRKSAPEGILGLFMHL